MKRDKTDFSSRIKELREAAGMNQLAFANVLGVARSLLAACEGDARKSSTREPSTDLLVRLGNAAAESRRFEDAIWFWQHAGVRVDSMVPATLELLKKTDAPITRGLMTSIPPAKYNEKGEKGERLLFPTGLLSKPIESSYVAVPDDSLLPMCKRGDVLVLDESETDPWKMVGSCVVAYRSTSLAAKVREMREKLTDAEYDVYAPQRPGRLGLYVGWLNEVKRNEDVSLNVEFPTTTGGMAFETLALGIRPLSGGSSRRKVELPEFSVLGRVVSWIDMRGMGPYMAATRSLPSKKQMSGQKQSRTAKKNTTRKDGK